ncbi:MAG: hypothetical protein JXN10_04080, partial [Clostridia bacterium]|nr:hypothetical protein [Clostridia bacterium]
IIELFSKAPNNFNLDSENGLTPIHIDDSIISLSAILLSDDYYNLLLKRKRNLYGYSIIEIEVVILLKIKAWLDMKARKEAGEKIDSRNIKKHKNDVFRLLANVSPTAKIKASGEIQNDVSQFIQLIEEDKPDLKNLGIRGTSFNDMLELLENIFLAV